MARCRLKVLLPRALASVSRGRTRRIAHSVHMLLSTCGRTYDAICLLSLLLAMVLGPLSAMQSRFLGLHGPTLVLSVAKRG